MPNYFFPKNMLYNLCLIILLFFYLHTTKSCPNVIYTKKKKILSIFFINKFKMKKKICKNLKKKTDTNLGYW